LDQRTRASAGLLPSDRARALPTKQNRNERGGQVSEYSTCHICKEDSKTEDMVTDISGTLYCYVCADICLVCGIYQHDCEGASV